MRVKTLLVLAVILLAAVMAGRSLFERGLHVVQRPLAAIGTWMANQMIPSAIQDAQNALSTLAIDQTRLERLERENQELREALDFIQRREARAVSASVIARSRSEQRWLFAIDRGSDDGIQTGDPVIVKDGILVGKIDRVTPASATVRALTDPDMGTAVGLLGRSQTIGVAEGISGKLLRVKFIPQGELVAVNDLVVTSGLETTIPSGLFVGLVNDVRPEPNAPFLEALVEPIVDVRQFRIVHILTEPPQNL
ncbi:rod shape-determining protein MreC [Candidatus Parcubacteria bacterium]|nr:rod shape-determining protein MreC [Candidatus Parcubacteria bacterium]